MNTRINPHLHDGPKTDFPHSIKAGLACVFAATMLLLSACSDGAPQIVPEAVAAPAEESSLYLPAQFPPIEGALEPHIEAF